LTVSGVMCPGIDIHQVPLFPKFVSQLSDVDAHATSISGTQIPYGTAVGTEHSYSWLTG